MVTNAAPAESRIDPRVVRTHRLIKDALRALLAEKNFESISVQDIAERATVNRATFYAHFADKFALLEAMIREEVAAGLSQGDPLGASSTPAMLEILANNVFRFVGAHRGCKIDRDFDPQFERAMEAEVAAFIAPKFSQCAAHLVGSAIVGAAMQWRARKSKEPVERVAREIVGILSDGVAKSAR